MTLFWDDDQGGVFSTGTDAEALVTRPKDLMDNALPSANSLAAMALLRLGSLTGDDALVARAGVILRLLGLLVGRHALAFGHLLCALELAVAGATEVVISGDGPELVEVVQREAFRPHVVLAWGAPYPSPLWEGREPTPGAGPRAFVCRNFVCELPATSAAALRSQLAG